MAALPISSVSSKDESFDMRYRSVAGAINETEDVIQRMNPEDRAVMHEHVGESGMSIHRLPFKEGEDQEKALSEALKSVRIEAARRGEAPPTVVVMDNFSDSTAIIEPNVLSKNERIVDLASKVNNFLEKKGDQTGVVKPSSPSKVPQSKAEGKRRVIHEPRPEAWDAKKACDTLKKPLEKWEPRMGLQLVGSLQAGEQITSANVRAVHLNPEETPIGFEVALPSNNQIDEVLDKMANHPDRMALLQPLKYDLSSEEKHEVLVLTKSNGAWSFSWKDKPLDRQAFKEIPDDEIEKVFGALLSMESFPAKDRELVHATLVATPNSVKTMRTVFNACTPETGVFKCAIFHEKAMLMTKSFANFREEHPEWVVTREGSKAVPLLNEATLDKLFGPVRPTVDDEGKEWPDWMSYVSQDTKKWVGIKDHLVFAEALCKMPKDHPHRAGMVQVMVRHRKAELKEKKRGDRSKAAPPAGSSDELTDALELVHLPDGKWMSKREYHQKHPALTPATSKMSPGPLKAPSPPPPAPITPYLVQSGPTLPDTLPAHYLLRSHILVKPEDGSMPYVSINGAQRGDLDTEELRFQMGNVPDGTPHMIVRAGLIAQIRKGGYDDELFKGIQDRTPQQMPQSLVEKEQQKPREISEDLMMILEGDDVYSLLMQNLQSVPWFSSYYLHDGFWKRFCLDIEDHQKPGKGDGNAEPFYCSLGILAVLTCSPRILAAYLDAIAALSPVFPVSSASKTRDSMVDNLLTMIAYAGHKFHYNFDFFGALLGTEWDKNGLGASTTSNHLGTEAFYRTTMIVKAVVHHEEFAVLFEALGKSMAKRPTVIDKFDPHKRLFFGAFFVEILEFGVGHGFSVDILNPFLLNKKGDIFGGFSIREQIDIILPKFGFKSRSHFDRKLMHLAVRYDRSDWLIALSTFSMCKSESELDARLNELVEQGENDVGCLAMFDGLLSATAEMFRACDNFDTPNQRPVISKIAKMATDGAAAIRENIEKENRQRELDRTLEAAAQEAKLLEQEQKAEKERLYRESDEYKQNQLLKNQEARAKEKANKVARKAEQELDEQFRKEEQEEREEQVFVDKWMTFIDNANKYAEQNWANYRSATEGKAKERLRKTLYYRIDEYNKLSEYQKGILNMTRGLGWFDFCETIERGTAPLDLFLRTYKGFRETEREEKSGKAPKKAPIPVPKPIEIPVRPEAEAGAPGSSNASPPVNWDDPRVQAADREVKKALATGVVQVEELPPVAPPPPPPPSDRGGRGGRGGRGIRGHRAIRLEPVRALNGNGNAGIVYTNNPPPRTLADVPNLAKPPPESTIGGETTCVVCFVDQKTNAAVPCGHMCVCVSCSEKLKQCPICRADVNGWLKVHLA